MADLIVVRGAPTAEELAALTVVLRRRGRRVPAPAVTRAAARWAPRGPFHAPGAWTVR